MDETGFTEWAVAAQRPLLRAAVLLTGDIHAAEDLVQEAMVKVAMRWSRLAEGSPTAYARTIMLRDYISGWRKHRRHAETDVLVPAPADTPDWDAAALVQQALARLTPKQRAVVVLRHLDDLSVREVAAVLRIGVGTVKSQNAAALERLREGAPELRDLIGRLS